MSPTRRLPETYLLTLACALAVACARESMAVPQRLDLGIGPPSTAQERVSLVDSTGLGLREPSLMNPAHVRSGPGGSYWLLDTGRGAVFSYRADGSFIRRLGRKGRERGQLRTPLALDVSPQGTAWVVDVGNGKVVGFDTTGGITEIPIDFQPAGIAAPSDDDLWIAGDLRTSVFVRLSRDGTRRGLVGTPADTGVAAFRGNQGTATHGSGSCAVLWAYAYRSRLECYAIDGRLRWRASGPTPVEWPIDANPFQMSANDRLAFLDLTAGEGRVLALFLGGAGIPQSAELQVFDESTGAFLGTAPLSEPATHLAAGIAGLATVQLEGERATPHLRVYPRAKGGAGL